RSPREWGLAASDVEAESNTETAPCQSPQGSDPTITFLSGVTVDASVAPFSFGSWAAAGSPVPPPPADASVPPPPIAYHRTLSFTTKWGDTNLLPGGTPGGDVSFWFDTASNWNPTEREQWLSALDLWSAVANITFTEAPDAASAAFTLFRQPNQPNPQTGT